MTTVRVKLGEDGRISLPAAYRRALGLRPGDELIVQLQDGAISVTSTKLGIERARRMLGRYLKTKESLADSLIADRRSEAACE
jgi:AbrB family looped-hinge helix DNA binding protein